MKFGNLIKTRRLELEYNLRGFCLKFGHDPSNWSKTERGLIPPPSDPATLKKIAENLEIALGSGEWLNLHDAAFLERGQIPPYIQENEEAMAKLPLFFRTVSGNKPSQEELEELAGFLQRNP